MNTDYLIQTTTKQRGTWRHLKAKDGWRQTAPTGIVCRSRGDQLLSHLLPAFAGDQSELSVSVECERILRQKRQGKS